MFRLLSNDLFYLRLNAGAEVLGDGREGAVEIGPLFVGQTVTAGLDPTLDQVVEFSGDFLAGGGQGQHGPVSLLAQGSDITPVSQLGNRAGDGSLVLGAEAAELGRGQTGGILPQVVQAHDMGALQTKFGHLHGFDSLDVFVACGDAGNKGIETLDHRKASVSWFR